MQLISVFNQFWRLRMDFDLSDSEVALFFAILSEINRARAENNNLLESEVKIKAAKLVVLSGVPESSIYRARNRLKQLGFIDFKKGSSKKNYATYSLGKLFRVNERVETQFSGSSEPSGCRVNERVNETLNERVRVNERVENQSIKELESSTRRVNETLNETLNERLNERVNERLNERLNERVIYKEKREERRENKDIYIPELEENTNVFSSNSPTSVGQLSQSGASPPDWYQSLNRFKKSIVDTWEAIISPFDPAWLPLLDEALKICYPAQVKNAIVVLAKTKAEVMQEQGFEYVLEPLRKGAFGRRGKSGKSRSDNKKDGKRDWLEKFKNPFGKETLSDEEFLSYFVKLDSEE